MAGGGHRIGSGTHPGGACGLRESTASPAGAGLRVGDGGAHPFVDLSREPAPHQASMRWMRQRFLESFALQAGPGSGMRC